MEMFKPGVCHAGSTLKEGAFLTVDEKFSLRLTDVGWEVAEQPTRNNAFYPLVDGGGCQSKNSGTGCMLHGAYDRRE